MILTIDRTYSNNFELFPSVLLTSLTRVVSICRKSLHLHFLSCIPDILAFRHRQDDLERWPQIEPSASSISMKPALTATGYRSMTSFRSIPSKPGSNTSHKPRTCLCIVVDLGICHTIFHRSNNQGLVDALVAEE